LIINQAFGEHTNLGYVEFLSRFPLRTTNPYQGPLKFAIHLASVCQLGKGAVMLKFLAHLTRHNSLSQTFLAE
jgi:hypothetical protein